MTQLTAAGLWKVLAHVSAIMSLMLLGAVAGLVLYLTVAPTPLVILGGLALGSLAAATGIWMYIRAHARDVTGSDPPPTDVPYR
ncbi:MAG TPA: hypothetical protein VHK06_03630 [Candidatus Limnocylindria bacterium]|jgi:hypothetical protein|nr:hypothetical protein [Candidatus Limnocylindria bacterium]